MAHFLDGHFHLIMPIGSLKLDPFKGNILERILEEVAHPVSVIQNVLGGHFRILHRRDFLSGLAERLQVEVET